MTQLYKITPKTEGCIKSILKLIEGPANPGVDLASRRRMSVITVYKTGYAYRSIDDPLYLEDLNNPIACKSDLGIPELNDENLEKEFEFGLGLDGLYADSTREAFVRKWTEGGDGLKGLDYFTSDKMDTPAWTIDSTEIRILGPVTIDKVDGDQYTNIVESNIQPVSKYAEAEPVPQGPRFGLDFRL